MLILGKLKFYIYLNSGHNYRKYITASLIVALLCGEGKGERGGEKLEMGRKDFKPRACVIVVVRHSRIVLVVCR